jgi:DNA invertase Pin-like site-specific DNA recombinase
MIQARIHAGLARAKANGKKLGRPLRDPGAVDKARLALDEGMGVNRVAKMVGLSNGKVAELKAENEKLKATAKWLDGQLTTVREQRDALAQQALSR